MIKSVFKEIIIGLLLIAVIILLFGILFYNYMPNTKTIPEKVEEYSLAEDVKEELQQELSDTKSEEIIKTYQLDATDLETYVKTKEYNKGKVNPFENVASGNTNNSGSTNNNSNGSTNNNSNNTGSANNTTTNTNVNTENNTNANESEGTFLNVSGK